MVRIALVSYVVLIALAPMYGDNWDSFHPLVSYSTPIYLLF
jgi:hypothetical protein